MKYIAMGTLVLLLLARPCAADDPEPTIENLRLAFEGSRVLVSCDLRHAFDTRAQERINSGLPTSFLFEMQLVRDRRWWFWDRKVARTSVEMVVQYNAVTLEYLVNQKVNDKLVASRVVQDLAELEPAMTQLRDVPAFMIPEPPPSGHLKVRVRADLGSRTVLSMIPIRIDTSWAESETFESSPIEPGAETDTLR